MMLNTTMILDLLRERPGRYIQHDMGHYRMKEANGDDVKVTENGREYLVEPVAEQMDDLTDASKVGWRWLEIPVAMTALDVIRL